MVKIWFQFLQFQKHVCLHKINITNYNRFTFEGCHIGKYHILQFDSMTSNTKHVKGKEGYNGGMTLILSRGVRVRYFHMGAKLYGSLTDSLRENPIRGFRVCNVRFSSNFHLSSQTFELNVSSVLFRILVSGLASD